MSGEAKYKVKSYIRTHGFEIENEAFREACKKRTEGTDKCQYCDYKFKCLTEK